MHLATPPRPVLRAALAYVGAAVLALLAAAWVLRLGEADLRVPFSYRCDGFLHQLWLKGVLDNGWPLRNPRLGMPGGHEMYDYPQAEAVHFLFVRALGLVSRHPGKVYNLYYLLTFPLCAVAALFALRRLGFSWGPSLVAGLLYALLPYHFLRVEHLFLAAYYLVPLVVLLAVQVYRDEDLFWPAGAPRPRWPRPGRDGAFWLGALVCVLVGSGGVYYAFFGCYLLLAAALAAAVRQHSARPLANGGFGILLVTAALLANLAPNLAYFHAHGLGDRGLLRYWWHSELYGLKIAQLLLPVGGHRLGVLAHLKEAYDRAAPLRAENDTATLGAFGSVGFVFVVGAFLLRRPRPGAPGLPEALGMLTCSALLLGLLGGGAPLFSLLVCSWVRAYARISVFVAFLSVAGSAYLLEALARRWGNGPGGRAAFALLLLGLGALGALDQTTPAFAPHHAALRAAYANDARFVKDVEARLPDGALVFQLPYVPFLESGCVQRMEDYDHLRGYLHSDRLRWSYGAMKGRDTDAWQFQVTALPVEEMLGALRDAGFAGVYLDRHGFAGGGADAVAGLTRCLGPAAVASADQRFLFFPLGPGAPAAAPDERERRRRAARERVVPLPARGFALQQTPEGWEFWGAPRCEVVVVNPSPRPQRVRWDLAFRNLSSRAAHLRLGGPLLTAALDVEPAEHTLSRSFTVPPGRHTVVFDCDAPPVSPAVDPRVLVFRLTRLTMRPEPAPSEN